MGLGPRNPTKKLTHLVDLLGHLLFLNHVSNFSDLGFKSHEIAFDETKWVNFLVGFQGPNPLGPHPFLGPHRAYKIKKGK